MANLNELRIDGRLGCDPEIVNTSGGHTIIKMAVCHSNSKKVNGEWQDEPCWFDVDYFLHEGENAEQFHKGAFVKILARMRQYTWEKDGKKNSKLKFSASEVKVIDLTERYGNKTNPTLGSKFEDDIPF
jgi:single stranded DNA-binding protein